MLDSGVGEACSSSDWVVFLNFRYMLIWYNSGGFRHVLLKVRCFVQNCMRLTDYQWISSKILHRKIHPCTGRSEIWIDFPVEIIMQAELSPGDPDTRVYFEDISWYRPLDILVHRQGGLYVVGRSTSFSPKQKENVFSFYNV